MNIHAKENNKHAIVFFTIISTLGFSNTNILQLYAGKYNIAFASDDIVVLEPHFWKIMYVQVNQN